MPQPEKEPQPELPEPQWTILPSHPEPSPGESDPGWVPLEPWPEPSFTESVPPSEEPHFIP